jgi:hypothetical protein
MNGNGLNYGSLIAGVISIGSAASIAMGYPAIGAIISDPHTSQAMTAIVGGIAGLWSLFAPALLHTTTVNAASDIATIAKGPY